MRGEGCDASAVLDGFFVTGGDAVSKGHTAGGGLYLRDGSPTIRRCVFVENRARDEGGGAYLKGSAASFESCTFSRNKTGGFFATSGGGMYNEKSNPRVTDCTFSENRAHRGGGMFNTNSRPALFIKKYRIKILAFAVFFVMVGILLLSEIYMIKESNHECHSYQFCSLSGCHLAEFYLV